MAPLTTQERLSKAYLLRSGLKFYHALLRVQNSQTLCEIEFLESLLAQQDAHRAMLQYQQALVDPPPPELLASPHTPLTTGACDKPSKVL